MIGAIAETLTWFSAAGLLVVLSRALCRLSRGRRELRGTTFTKFDLDRVPSLPGDDT